MLQRTQILILITVVALLSAACATKKSLRTEVTRIDTEMDQMQASIETGETRLQEHDAKLADHGRQLSELSAESSEALQRAQSAEKLAQGKLLYEITLTDDSVKFAYGNAEINPGTREILDNLVNQLKGENKNIYIEIQGFTDSSGPKEYNLKLGLDRAEAVRRYLSEAGIPLHRISTISYGEERPVAENNTRQGRSKNRRVVIQVLV